MQQKRQYVGGKHRKQTSQTKGRAAFVALATTAVSSAGATGAALAHTSGDNGAEIKLTADEAAALPQGSAAPQILSIAEFKPTVDLGDQLTKAAAYSLEVAAADQAARTPKVTVAKPAEGTLTSPFGPRWGTFHSGIDIANSIGTPILAVMSGTVIDSGPASGYGQWIRIQHEDGSISVYGHMETLDVVAGQHVDAGQKIAGMGSRGFSTGSHLHFEIHPGGGSAVDPAAWLAERGVSV